VLFRSDAAELVGRDGELVGELVGDGGLVGGLVCGGGDGGDGGDGGGGGGGRSNMTICMTMSSLCATSGLLEEEARRACGVVQMLAEKKEKVEQSVAWCMDGEGDGEGEDSDSDNSEDAALDAEIEAQLAAGGDLGGSGCAGTLGFLALAGSCWRFFTSVLQTNRSLWDCETAASVVCRP
jgi:hypothetical protein